METCHLVKHYTGNRLFSVKKEIVRAVDGVSIKILEGETLGLVGESGCGKSTLARLILRLEAPTAGDIYFEGEAVTRWTGEELRLWRRKIQVIFQDSYASLNPRMKVGRIVGETLYNFEKESAREREHKVDRLLYIVGLEPQHRHRYPHELSGGQRQRIAIARALALNPQIIVCDESVASLDVSIQAQVLNLLKELRDQFGLSYLFISHDLATVKYISHRVAVMYLGKIVEIVESQTLKEEAMHPYTRTLLAAVPLPEPGQKIIGRSMIKGEPPNPVNPPPGCRFHPRCPQAKPICREEEPALKEKKKGHPVACHLV